MTFCVERVGRCVCADPRLDGGEALTHKKPSFPFRRERCDFQIQRGVFMGSRGLEKTLAGEAWRRIDRLGLGFPAARSRSAGLLEASLARGPPRCFFDASRFPRPQGLSTFYGLLSRKEGVGCFLFGLSTSSLKPIGKLKSGFIRQPPPSGTNFLFTLMGQKGVREGSSFAERIL